MNKPDWHNEWVYRERVVDGYYIKEIYKVNEPVLDDWLVPFVKELNERLKQNGN